MNEELKQAGYKMTRPRRAILDYLEGHHQPQSAQDIHESLKRVDLASVYRTLGLFEELGIVQREDVSGTARYYLATDPHHHVTCRGCGSTKCVPCKHEFTKISGFTNITHQLILAGTCSGCSK